VVQCIMHRRVARRQSDKQRCTADGKENSRLDQERKPFRNRKTQSTGKCSFHGPSPVKSSHFHPNRQRVSSARAAFLPGMADEVHSSRHFERSEKSFFAGLPW